MDSTKESQGWQFFLKKLKDKEDTVVTILIQACRDIIETSQESTMQGLTTLLDDNVAYLLKKLQDDDSVLRGRSNMSLQSAYNIFKSHLSKSLRISSVGTEFKDIKSCMLWTADEFIKQTRICKESIKDLALDFVKNGMVNKYGNLQFQTIFVYGFSRLVQYFLQGAVEKGKRFSVITSECRPKCEGYDLFTNLSKKVPVKVILDSAIAYGLEMCDIVLVGAEAVVENGGIINRAGTYTVGICAKTLKKPFYVLSESFKFTRMFPISQEDLPEFVISKKTFELPADKEKEIQDAGLKDKLITHYPLSDYTPPELITMIFTDLGIFTPSAVSDELIQIFDV